MQTTEQKIKRKLDRAADLIHEARVLARTLHPCAYIYCEGSGKIYARTGEGDPSDSSDVFVTSKQSRFDAGGW